VYRSEQCRTVHDSYNSSPCPSTRSGHPSVASGTSCAATVVQWRTHVDIPVCSGGIVCQSCSAVHWCRAIDGERITFFLKKRSSITWLERPCRCRFRPSVRSATRPKPVSSFPRAPWPACITGSATTAAISGPCPRTNSRPSSLHAGQPLQSADGLRHLAGLLDSPEPRPVCPNNTAYRAGLLIQGVLASPAFNDIERDQLLTGSRGWRRVDESGLLQYQPAGRDAL